MFSAARLKAVSFRKKRQTKEIPVLQKVNDGSVSMIIKRFKSYMQNGSNDVKVKFLKFLVIGGFATAIDVIVFCIEYNIFNINYLVANTISFTIGLVISYYMTRNMVFNYKNHVFLRDFALFAITSVMGLFISNYILYLLIDRRLLEDCLAIINFDKKSIISLTAKIIASFVVLIWNFITKNLIVFKK